MGVNDAREQLEVCKDEYGKLERENARLWADLAVAEDQANNNAADAVQAERQVAELQTVIERVRKAEPTWHRGMYGCPQDMFSRSDLARILAQCDEEPQ